MILHRVFSAIVLVGVIGFTITARQRLAEKNYKDFCLDVAMAYWFAYILMGMIS